MDRLFSFRSEGFEKREMLLQSALRAGLFITGYRASTPTPESEKIS